MKVGWKSLALVDLNGRMWRGEQVIDALQEFRQYGTMQRFNFAHPMPRQERLDPEEWGPDPEEVDWTDFPGEED